MSRVFKCQDECGRNGYIYTVRSRHESGGCDTCGYGEEDIIEVSRDCAICRTQCGFKEFPSPLLEVKNLDALFE